MGLRVLLAEPQTVLRKGLRTLFESDGRVSTILEVTTEKDLRRYVSQQLWDLIVVDQSLLTDMQFLPAGKFAVLTLEVDIMRLREAYMSRACAYFSMDVPGDIFTLLLQYVNTGFILGPTITRWLMMHAFNQPFPPINEALLTPREKEIISLLRSGASRTNIARQLCIAETTLKTHIKNIARKRGLGRLRLQYEDAPFDAFQIFHHSKRI